MRLSHIKHYAHIILLGLENQVTSTCEDHNLCPLTPFFPLSHNIYMEASRKTCVCVLPPSIARTPKALPEKKKKKEKRQRNTQVLFNSPPPTSFAAGSPPHRLGLHCSPSGEPQATLKQVSAVLSALHLSYINNQILLPPGTEGPILSAGSATLTLGAPSSGLTSSVQQH